MFVPLSRCCTWSVAIFHATHTLGFLRTCRSRERYRPQISSNASFYRVFPPRLASTGSSPAYSFSTFPNHTRTRCRSFGCLSDCCAPKDFVSADPFSTRDILQPQVSRYPHECVTFQVIAEQWHRGCGASALMLPRPRLPSSKEETCRVRRHSSVFHVSALLNFYTQQPAVLWAFHSSVIAPR